MPTRNTNDRAVTAEVVLRFRAILAGNDPAEDEEMLLSDLLADPHVCGDHYSVTVPVLVW